MKFWPKKEILAKKGNFGQTRNSSAKTNFWSKTKFSFKNRNFGPQIKFGQKRNSGPKTNFGQKRNFVQKTRMKTILNSNLSAPIRLG